MKKLMTLLICAALAIGTAAAQNRKTYTGFVVDKNGNPLIGAEVMAPGGGASTITDSDGSFTIEVPFLLKKLTATYTGMGEKSIKLGESSNLVFKMRNLKKMTGFISFVGNVGFDKYSNDENYSNSDASLGGGIMGGQIGQLGKWGWYVKAMGYFDFYYINTEGGSLTAGAIRKLGSKAHLYFGGGAAYLYDDECFGFSADLGIIFTVSNHLNIITGINYAKVDHNDYYYDEYYDGYNYNYYRRDYTDKYNIINLTIGVGYTF